MGSTFGGLNILSRSLYAQQASLDTVGHNIANANTEGYSRQRVNLATALPAGEVYGRTLHHSGSGVTVASITRARDVFVDQQLWKESSTQGYSQKSSEALSRMEGVFNEPSETGIQTVLNQFWTSWQTLATNASDSGARAAVAQRGVQVVNAIQHAAMQLKDTAENINSEVVSSVSKINQISSNIYKLNGEIANMEFTGTDHANDLRDSRDLLVDQLSSLVDISVKEDSAGNYKIQSNGVTLVDANSYNKLGTKPDPTDPTDTTDPQYDPKYDPTDPQYDPYAYKSTTVVDASGAAVVFTTGEVKALIDSRDLTTTGIKGYMSSLEKVSQFLLQDFNAVHRDGYGTDNNDERNFFGDGDPSNTDYKTLPTTGTPPVTTPPDGGWIKALLVNKDITGSTDGLKIIASKSLPNGIAVTVPTTNTGSGVPAVSITSGTYAGDVRIKVTVINGKVTNIASSTDGGVTWGGPSGTTNSSTSITSLTIGTQTLSIDTSKLTAPADGNIYNFTLSSSSAANGIAVTAGSTNQGSGVPAASTTGTYTGGTTATDLRVRVTGVNTIEYSTDGGKTYPYPPITSGSPYELDVKGLKIELDTSLNPNIGNVYQIILSSGNNASGDNAIKLGNRLKNDVSATLGNTSLDAYYSSIIGTLGVQSQDAQRTNTNQHLVVDQLTNHRQSTSGVNMDEEMTDMIRFQKGYNAAARVLTAMDEMLDKLINGTGMVGR